MHKTLQNFFVAKYLSVVFIFFASGCINALLGQQLPPDPPGQVILRIANSNTIAVRWRNASTTETGYIIERATGTAQDFSLVGTAGPIDSILIDDSQVAPRYDPGKHFGEFFDQDNFTENERYFYRVITQDTTGTSDYSDTVKLIFKKPLFDRLTDNPMETDSSTISFSGFWNDYDNDKDLDLLIHNWGINSRDVRHENYFYENDGAGNFKRVVIEGITTGEFYSRAGTWADIDNDGDQDFIYGPSVSLEDEIRTLILYVNNGDQSFEKLIIDDTREDLFWTLITVADFNNDGWLDIFGQKEIYINDQQNSFTKLANENNPIINLQDTFLTHVFTPDYNNDGFPDIFITGDSGPELYKNIEGTQFERVMSAFSSIGRARGATWADFDIDGDLDVVLSDPNDNEQITFFENSAGEFQVVKQIDNVVSGRGFTVADLDNNGLEDIIFLVNPLTLTEGMLTSEKYPTIWFNEGNFDFTPLDESINSFAKSNQLASMAVADYNQDGAMDIYMTGNGIFETSGNHLYKNVIENGNNWLRIDLEGTESNVEGIGAKISVYTGEDLQFRQVNRQNGVFNGNDKTAHFGLGNSDIIDSVKVVWPSGIHDTLFDVMVNQSITIEEGAEEEIVTSIVQEVDDEDMRLYPNPAKSELSIQLGQKLSGSLVKITNMHGVVVYNTELDSNKKLHTLNIDFPSGLYIITVSNSHSNITRPFVVKK